VRDGVGLGQARAEAATVMFHVGRFGHPFFREQLHGSPDGFRYLAPGAEPSATATKRISLDSTRLRGARDGLERAAVRGLSDAGYVRRSRLRVPPGCALVHSAQQLLRSMRTPYVVDFECIEAFSLYQRAALTRPWARARLLAALEGDDCRMLLPWSRVAERGLAAALGEESAQRLRHKTHAVLPGIRARARRPSARTTGPLRVLFVGTAFEAKGGVEAIRALDRVRRTHDVTLDLISDVPAGWRSEIDRVGGVAVHSWPTPAAKVESLFAGSHVLLFPSHMDTLGFVIFEALAHGVPVVATRHFAVPELVEDDVSGLLIEGENLLYGEDGLCRFAHTLPPPRSFRDAIAKPTDAYVSRLADALAGLAEEPGLHERLAAGALARVTDGPLSMDARRSALGAAYRAALAA
jgi:glycosyltransferase involved in cell wall biosynthesis